jgi:hypothetical protein
VELEPDIRATFYENGQTIEDYFRCIITAHGIDRKDKTGHQPKTPRVRIARKLCRTGVNSNAKQLLF